MFACANHGVWSAMHKRSAPPTFFSASTGDLYRSTNQKFQMEPEAVQEVLTRVEGKAFLGATLVVYLTFLLSE